MRDLDDIARHKAELIARCAAQRTAIADAIEHLRGPAGAVDRGLSVVRFVRAHPVLVGAVIAGMAALKRRTLVGWLGRGIAAWRLYRGIGAWARRFGVAVPRGGPRAGSGNVAP